MAKSFTYQEIADHNSEQDLWLIINGKVYDCSKFADEHPGGDEVLLDLGGQDATIPFLDIGHTDDAVKLLDHMYIGDVDETSEKVHPDETETVTTTTKEGAGALWLAFIFIFWPPLTTIITTINGSKNQAAAIKSELLIYYLNLDI
ncbi:Cyb5p Ecym_5420 [Eremothecium cymbalariae DBVPG|uniref:Cytochrome b5 heme-binding domain-containing protein n=1 Tax=Eremothecium cymbalariae (strain CBS 270.75 / DBVPG 7215 / KCTC 17166 / NRRL Y-17582) TaxID=931890 RepID=I6NDN2_ERECY|nr:hypothetical protein Ecym_5420 [Eremothecium cymbalariae DBVPG\